MEQPGNYFYAAVVEHARTGPSDYHWRLNRNESRGAHYKPEFPERNDEEWLKTTKAMHTEDGPQFTYEDVDISLIKPRERATTFRNRGRKQMGKTVQLIITRQKDRDSQPYKEEFEIPYRQNMNVISALDGDSAQPCQRKGGKNNAVAWEANCLEEVCGACSMVINGKAVRRAPL